MRRDSTAERPRELCGVHHERLGKLIVHLTRFADLGIEEPRKKKHWPRYDAHLRHLLHDLGGDCDELPPSQRLRGWYVPHLAKRLRALGQRGESPADIGEVAEGVRHVEARQPLRALAGKHWI